MTDKIKTDDEIINFSVEKTKRVLEEELNKINPDTIKEVVTIVSLVDGDKFILNGECNVFAKEGLFIFVQEDPVLMIPIDNLSSVLLERSDQL